MNKNILNPKLFKQMIDSPIEEIKNRLNLLDVVGGYLKLQKTGANYRGLCPFHSEKTPSFFVSPARQVWKCFGCNKAGDVFKFIQEIEGVEFGDALRTLAQRAGVQLKREDSQLRTERQRLCEISELAVCFFEKQLNGSDVGKKAKEYLLKRGVTDESIGKWRLGYSPDKWRALSDFLVSRGYKRQETEKAGLAIKSETAGNFYDRFRGRIIFPIFDLNSQPVGFGARIFEPEKAKNDKDTVSREEVISAKYINTPATLIYDKSRILYGLDKAKLAIKKSDNCILVEGYMDVIMVSQNGFENVAAVSGTALTLYQLKILKRYSNNLLISFDMDTAGSSGTKRGINLAQAEEFNIKIVTMPEGMDPADVLLKKPDLWSGLVAGAKSIMEFYLETALKEHDRETADGKKKIAAVLLPAIKVIANRVEQTFWIERLAKELRAREEDLRAEMEKAKADKAEVSSANNQPPVLEKNKSKKEILEKRLFVLLAKYPDKLSLIEGGDFFSPEAKIVFDFFKNNPDFIVNKNFPEEIAAVLNEVLFLSEAEEISAIEADRDFKKCLKELSRIALKDVLGRISKDIRIAEADDPEKAKQLLEEFNRLSKKLYDVEKS